MSSHEKRLQKFVNHPVSLKYHEIETLLYFFGFQMIEGKGSHKKFKQPKLKDDLIIPVHNYDCKEHYKKKAAKFLKTLRNLEQ